jgi:hypothetical protein
MAVTGWYRLSSFEVGKISPKGQPFDDQDPAYFGTFTDPLTPDGGEYVDPNGDLRVLGYAKFYETGSNTCRNATQPEIDSFEPAQLDDEAQQEADSVAKLILTHPRFRRAFKAFLKRIIAENNITNGKLTSTTADPAEALIGQWNRFKADVAAAANLGQLQAAVAALPVLTDNAPQRTLAQAITALLGDIDKND